MESSRAVWTPLLAVVLTTAGGCTSAISTAYLRDALWEVSDHASEEAAQAADSGADATSTARAANEPGSGVDGAAASGGAEVDGERRQAAIDEAVARLARIGRLDAATKMALVQTLQQTAQEDWPVVVDTFAESLEASVASQADVAAEAAALVADVSAASASHDVGPVVAAESAPPAVVDAPMPPAAALAAVEAEAPLAPVPPTPMEPDVGPGEPISPAEPGVPPPAAVTEAHASGPSLAGEFAVRHACFAKRVQGWGVVDRFPESRFVAGQDVIVYVELDHLSAGESPAGHTTCVAASLRLVDDEGHTVHEWTFDPIVETCPTRRHDYFARYVVRIPESAPLGGCRLSIRAVDTLAGRTAATDLPLQVVSRQVAAR